MLGEYRENRTGLLIYLATLLQEADGDLANQLGHDRLRDRFLTWARAR
ncbi:hypothetical protein GCM10009848_61680 [Micromonospora lupini]